MSLAGVAFIPMQTKSILSILIVIGSWFTSNADRIIFRNGVIDDTKIVQVRDSKIIYTNLDVQDKKLEVPTKDIFMISIEDVGNIYFNEFGERKAGESKSAKPSKSDIVYLVSGYEIPCEKVRVSGDFVSFKVKDNNIWKGLKGVIGFNKKKEQIVPKEDVFMICYRNGTNDFITPLVEEIEFQPEHTEPTPVQNEFTVVFHQFKSGEKLENIASKYNVSVEDIAKWNDLNKVKGKYKATPGGQLMIYVKPQ